MKKSDTKAAITGGANVLAKGQRDRPPSSPAPAASQEPAKLASFAVCPWWLWTGMI